MSCYLNDIPFTDYVCVSACKYISIVYTAFKMFQISYCWNYIKNIFFHGFMHLCDSIIIRRHFVFVFASNYIRIVSYQ